MLQFDNWDIKPLHAVKVYNKEMPIVNGSLVQGASRKWGSEVASAQKDNALPENERREIDSTSSWKPVSYLGTRDEFTTAFESVENEIILSQFADVVFGITSLFRSALLGGVEQHRSEYNTGTRN